MKTYKEFMSEAAPLLAAPLIMKGIGAGLAATGLTGMIMQARKQGEGRRSQPVDYGQGGTATPRGKSVQRGRLNPNDAYNRAKREERKKEAQRRARERAEQGIDELIGSEEERRYAKQKRKERGIEEAAALAIPAAMKVAPYVIPTLGGIVKGVSAITNRETGLSDSEKRRVGELMDIIKRKKQREKTQQTEKDILDYGRKKKGIKEQTTRLVNVRTVGGITRGIDPSTGAIRIIKGRTKKEQEAVKNPPGFEMY